jgi:uncharacterized protein (TIGR02598 family)
VVLAIGLVMFSAVVILSLLPIGLNSLQDSSRQIVETQIFKAIEAEMSATSYDKLEDYQASRFPMYFSPEGVEMSGGEDAPFTVRCGSPVVETGGEAKRVTVSIGYHQDPIQTNARGKISKRTFLLVDRGE